MMKKFKNFKTLAWGLYLISGYIHIAPKIFLFQNIHLLIYVFYMSHRVVLGNSSYIMLHLYNVKFSKQCKLFCVLILVNWIENYGNTSPDVIYGKWVMLPFLEPWKIK